MKPLTCCACTNRAVAFVLDGAFHKPACEQHERLYGKAGYRTKPIGNLRNPPEQRAGGDQ